MKTFFIKLSSIFMLSFMLYNCVNNKDPFYTKKGGWDYERIPLIKPYFANNNGNGWLIAKPSASNIDGLSELIGDVTHIQVEDSIILFRWNKDTSITKYTDTTWGFVVVPFGIEKIFSNEQEYLDSLKHYTNITPSFRDIEDVWEQFSKTGYLEWFPDEYKPKK